MLSLSLRVVKSWSNLDSAHILQRKKDLVSLDSDLSCLNGYVGVKEVANASATLNL